MFSSQSVQGGSVGQVLCCRWPHSAQLMGGFCPITNFLPSIISHPICALRISLPAHVPPRTPRFLITKLLTGIVIKTSINSISALKEAEILFERFSKLTPAHMAGIQWRWWKADLAAVDCGPGTSPIKIRTLLLFNIHLIEFARMV